MGKIRPQVMIYTDGSCHPNPGGFGGWGVILLYKNKRKTLYGSAVGTTNNQMEMQAAIEALEALTKPCHVYLHTDSQYVSKGMSEWIKKWKLAGRLRDDGPSLKNKKLWQKLDALSQKHKVEWIHVRGHSGNELNEQADELANKGRLEAEQKWL